VEHLVAADRDTVEAIGAIAALLESAHVHVYVPGCRAVSVTLMERGFVIDATSLFMASTADLVHPLVQVVHPGLG
jgi:hypothetical protein